MVLDGVAEKVYQLLLFKKFEVIQNIKKRVFEMDTEDVESLTRKRVAF